jgi:hypothetical protein
VGEPRIRFYEVLPQVIGLLVLERAILSQAHKRRFDLDYVYLTELKAEIIEVHRLAVDLDDIWNDSACYKAPLNGAGS